MCRLLLATGRFDAGQVLEAAVDMACGRTADHEGPIFRHPNGWGAVWRDPDGSGRLRVHRDVRPIEESFQDSPLVDLRTDVLAIHTRHATIPTKLGLEFTHPLERVDVVPWYFMHNGFLPTVHLRLGLSDSVFDSREYFDYIVPAEARALDPVATLALLRDIPVGGSSGNAFAVNPYAAYVIHWTPPQEARPRYFGMSRLDTAAATFVSSEILPQFASAADWRPLPADHVLGIPFAPTARVAHLGKDTHHAHV
ncbi:class II glutamine amidotransferase [Micromonospora sp. L31]|uniref:class II glutamine amidotransferase n=1 Tax=Micromonospora sp. L31 TaxID=3452213 RepID=UPI003F88B30B